MASSVNADNGVVSGTAGLKSSADNSGVLDLQTNGTTALSISASQVVTYTNQPTYTGGTANGVLYLNGSKAVTRGSALTFDGTNFATTGSGTLKNLLFSTGTLPAAGNPSISLRSSDNVIYHQSGSANNIVFLDSAQNTMQSISATSNIFNISNSEAMRLNSTGLGIGTSSPDQKLTIDGGGAGFNRVNSDLTPANDSKGLIFVRTNGNGAGTQEELRYLARNHGWYNHSGTRELSLDSSGNLGLGVTPSAWAGPFKVYQAGTFGQHFAGQTNTADLKIGTNNYFNGSNYLYAVSSYTAMQVQLGQGVFNVAAAPSGTAGATITFTQIFAVARDQSLALQGATSQSGTGITFPATQSASSDVNTLDDYEEGTWTPVVSASGGSGSATYNTQSGKYLKIGKLVWANFFITFTKNTLSGGTLQVTGLPFTVNSSSSQYPEIAVLFDGMGANWTNPLAQVAQSTTVIDLIVGNGTTGTHAGLPTNTYLGPASMQLRGTAIYQAEN